MSLFDSGLNDLFRLISDPAPPPPPRRLAPPPPPPAFLLEQEEASTPKPPPPPPPRPRAATARPAASAQQKPAVKVTQRSQGKQGASSARPAGKQASKRGSSEAASAEKRDDQHAVTAFIPVMERDRDEEHGRGEQEEGSSAREMPAMGELDCELLTEDMTRQLTDDGIFEVLMPDGKTLGVVVKLDAQRAQFLLSPSDDDLANLLKQGKMELERRLARRMNKDVDISLL